MLRGIRNSSCLFAVGQQQVSRNASALFLKRRNSTVAFTEARPEEWEYAKPFKDIPGPKPLPIIGNAWRYIPYIGDLTRILEDSFHKILHEKYGRIMKITGLPGDGKMVMIFDPEDIEKVFRNEGQWPVKGILESFKYYRVIERKDIFQGVGGLASTQGEEWHNFRSKVNQTMLHLQSTKLYVGPIDAVANDFIKRIRQIRGKNLEMPDDFNNELFKWGLESIACIALDTRLGSLDANLPTDSEPQKMIDAIHVQLRTLLKLEFGIPFWKYVSTPTWRKFVNAADEFVEFCLKYVNQAMERLTTMPVDRDRELTILQKLLINDPDPKTATIMALDMIGAGIDTTSYTVANILYYLAKNPDKQQKLFEELQRNLPAKDQPVTSDILNNLKYLKACIKESMRMTTAAPINLRRTVKDMVLADYQVPKGTDILMPHLMLSNMDKYYPQADKFIPERWMKEDPQYNKAHPFVTLPFGFGPRMCIGRRFAELEIETVLTKVIRNFTVEYDYEMEYMFSLIKYPASPLKFRMSDRVC